MSAAESDGAHSKMWAFRRDGLWISCKAISTIVFVFPVPGGPEIKNGMEP